MNQVKINNENDNDKRPARNEGELNILGNRMKVLRDAKGLSTGKIAKLIGKTKASVIGYEQGYRYPLLRDAHKLAEVLGTSVAYLIGETDISTPPITKQTLGELIKTGDFHYGGQKLTDDDLDRIIEKLEAILKDAEDEKKA